MAIDSLRSGEIRICFDSGLNAYPAKCRILVEGQMITGVTPGAGSATPDVLIPMPSTRNIDALFGAGSVIAEGVKTAFACCPDSAMEIYALPRKDADVGATTQAAYTLTVTGPATSPGRIDLYIGDARWNTSTLVSSGDTATDIATNIVASLQADPTLPFNVAEAAGVVTLTAKNAGTVLNNVAIIPNWQQRQDYMPAGVTVAVAQSVTAADNIDATELDYSAILGECCYCCIAMLYDTPSWQNAMIGYIASAWDCSHPQCFGHGYTYNSGTLGEVLATDTNSAEVSRLAHCPTDPNLGWLKVAGYASLSCCSTVDNPETAIQGPNYGVLTCVKGPESCFQCWTWDEQQQLQATGFVVTTPLNGGVGSLTSPMVVNDITNNRYDDNDRLNSTWWNVNARRLAASTADAAAIQLNQVMGLGLFTKNTTVPPGIRGTNPNLILGSFRAWAKSEVGRLFSEFDDIDNDITIQTDFDVAPRCQGIPGKLWLNFVYRPPVRISNIIVTAKPEMLDNC